MRINRWPRIRPAAAGPGRLPRICVVTALIWSIRPVGSVANADDTGRVTARLEWERGEGASACMDRERLAQEVERRLRRRVFVSDDPAELAEVTVRGRIAASPERGGLVAKLELERADGRTVGTRELQTDGLECVAFEQGLPIVVALMVDLPRESSVLHIPAPSPAPNPTPAGAQPSPAEAGVRAGAPAQPEPALRPRPSWGWSFGTGLATAAGMLPGVILGSQTGGEVHPPSVPALRVEWVIWMPSLRLADGRGSLVWAWEASGGLCPAFLNRRGVRVNACVGAAVGRFHARGVGFDRSLEGTGPLAHVGAGARAEIAIGGPWWLALDLGLGLPLLRQVFVFAEDSSDTAFFRSPAVFARSALSVVLRLPR